MKRACALVLFVSLVAAACAPPRVDFREIRHPYRGRDYEEVWQRWTREGTLYHGFAQVVGVSATFKSWDFRQAYLAIYSERYALTPAEKATLEAKERAEHAAAHELFLSVSVEARGWRDLTRKESPWHISLVNERGDEVHPSAIEKLRPLPVDVPIFFPNHGPFGKAYVVRFPRKLSDGRDFLGASPRKVILRVAGGPGKTELTWETRSDAVATR